MIVQYWQRALWLSLSLALFVSGCGKQEPAKPTPPPAPPPKVQASAPAKEGEAVAMARKLGTQTANPVANTESGLQYIDVAEGSGAAAQPGNTVTVQYSGWLVSGAKFDSSVDRGRPFSFPLGAGQVIKGWDQGVAGMKPGGVRKLIIPPQLGYGSRGAPPVIPPDATLIFEVQLLAVQ